MTITIILIACAFFSFFVVVPHPFQYSSFSKYQKWNKKIEKYEIEEQSSSWPSFKQISKQFISRARFFARIKHITDFDFIMPVNTKRHNRYKDTIRFVRLLFALSFTLSHSLLFFLLDLVHLEYVRMLYDIHACSALAHAAKQRMSMCVNLKFRYFRFHMIIFYGCLLVLFSFVHQIVVIRAHRLDIYTLLFFQFSFVHSVHVFRLDIIKEPYLFSLFTSLAVSRVSEPNIHTENSKETGFKLI